MYSFISRHLIFSYFHGLNYWIHDIIIPIFFISLSIQFITTSKNIHISNGLVLLKLIAPIMFINGILLSYYIPNQKFGYLFRNYGYHFMITVCELYHTGSWKLKGNFPSYYNIRRSCQILFHMYLIYSDIYVLNYLWGHIREEIYLDFFIILYPLLFVNFLNIQGHYYNTIREQHKLNGYILLYLSSLGIFFSISVDKYWIFSRLQPFYIRCVIQNFPIFFFIRNVMLNFL